MSLFIQFEGFQCGLTLRLLYSVQSKACQLCLTLGDFFIQLSHVWLLHFLRDSSQAKTQFRLVTSFAISTIICLVPLNLFIKLFFHPKYKSCSALATSYGPFLEVTNCTSFFLYLSILCQFLELVQPQRTQRYKGTSHFAIEEHLRLWANFICVYKVTKEGELWPKEH